MTSEHLPATTQSSPEKREIALLKAVGWDRLAPEERELALAIATKYDLDPMLRHAVTIDGKPYVTRDGLLHVAHRSGKFDGISVTAPVLDGAFLRCEATVWRKDMTHPFVYPGRYPSAGRGRGPGSTYAEEMAIKVAESMALRRAFDVAAPTAEERWAADAEVSVTEPAKPSKLADIARERAAALESAAETSPEPTSGPQGVPEPAIVVSSPAEPEAASGAACGAVADDGIMTGSVCILEREHKGAHKSADGSWPRG